MLNTKIGTDKYHKGINKHQYDQADFPTVKHLELTNPMLWYHFISETVYETQKKKKKMSGNRPFVRTKIVLITSKTEQGGKISTLPVTRFLLTANNCLCWRG